MSRVYIRYIVFGIKTDSKSYISVIGYSRGTEIFYNKIHRTAIGYKQRINKHIYKQRNLSDTNVNIYSGWNTEYKLHVWQTLV
jgi:hypothetical protein